MASCAQIEPMLQAYVDGELAASQALIAEQHVGECPQCSALCARQKACSALLFEALHTHRLDTDFTPAVMAHLPEMELSRLNAHDVTWRAKHPRTRASRFFTFLPPLAAVLLLVLSAAIFLSWPPDNAGDTQFGMVTHQEGTVFRSEDLGTDTSRVVSGTFIGEEERFETREEAGLILSLAGPSHVKMAENTRVQVSSAREIAVEQGRVWLSVCDDGDLFRVQTPAGSVTVFGTVFEVLVSGESTVVTVGEGRVQVENDCTFATLTRGEQVAIALGKAVLKPYDVDPESVLAWASALQPDPSAEKRFIDLIPMRQSVVRGVHAYVFPTSHRAIQSLTFHWTPDIYSSGHAAYNVYVSDESMRPLFQAYLDSGIFNNQTTKSYVLAVPAHLAFEETSVITITVLPDSSIGKIKTPFTEIKAMLE